MLTLPLASISFASDDANIRGQIAELQAKQRVLHEWQKRQRDSIAAMRAEVERSKQEHRAPDPAKLRPLTSANGDHSQAYREAPRYIQQRIDQVDHDLVKKVEDALRHAIAFVGGRRLLFRQNYEVAIERSQRLRALLDEDERALTAELTTARKRLEEEKAKTRDRQSFTDAHRERIDAALAALERKVDALQESRVPLQDIVHLARSVIEPITQLGERDFQFRDRFFQAAASYKTSCKRLPELRLEILAHATSAIRQAKQAQATYERARSSVDRCASIESARAAAPDLAAATSQRERARKEEAEVEKGMDLLARLLADVPRLRSTREQLRGLQDQFAASVQAVPAIAKRIDEIEDDWDERYGQFRSQQRALVGQIDRVRGGLEAEGMTLSQQRLAAIRARAAHMDVAAPTFRIRSSALAEALSTLRLSTQTMEVIDLVRSCEGIELPAGMAQQAGSEVYLAFLDPYDQAEQIARECLASLEPQGTTADAERRRRLEFIRKHAQGDDGSRRTDYHSLAAQQRRAEEARRRAEEEHLRAEEARRREAAALERARARAEQRQSRDRSPLEALAQGFLRGDHDAGDPPPDTGSDGREQSERDTQPSQDRAARERRAATQREEARRRLRNLESAIASTRKNLSCLEEGKRLYPQLDLDCGGHYMIGARSRLIAEARARLVRLTRERARLGSLPASSLER